MKRYRFLAVIATLACVLTAPLSAATVTLRLAGGVLSNAAGTAIPTGGLVLLVASTTDTTFTAPLSTASTTVGSLIAADDLIIGSATIDSAAFTYAGGFTKSIAITFTGNLNAGDPVQLYWFPTLTSSNTTIGQNVAYGSYRTDSVAIGSEIAWVLPADGADADLKILTATAGGTLPDTTGRATLSTDGTVVTAPSITTHPVSLASNVGSSAMFSVTATGTALTYQWKKDGNNVASNGTSSSYTIPSVASGDTGSYTVTVANTAGSVTSNAATLTVTTGIPAITTQPASTTVNAGSSATFTVAASGTGLSYQWRKNNNNISGATSSSYTINPTALSDAGSYSVVVSNTTGPATSNAATLTVLPVFTGPAPDGYASSVTGGGAATTSNHTVVTTESQFRTLAESTNTAVITVQGTITLTSKVSVKSNKTIQGLDNSATIIGNLELASGVSNVVIRGLDITNPNGDGLTLSGATNVYVTHVSFYNCSDTLLRISAGADNVTVTWCEFYYTSAQTAHRYATLIGASSGETKALRVTLAYNWYSDRVDQQMPDSTYGQVHLFNNYFNPNGTANTSGSIARANAQFLAERNQYTSIVSPLTKTAGGLIRDLGNGYSANAPVADTVADTVFTPSYSYRLMNRADVVTLVSAPSGAGNAAGAASLSTNTGSASINASGTAITTGSGFTLTTASISGVTPSTYQWRMNNADIAGATSASYNVASAQSANAGIYTVAVSNVSGETVVSSPVTISVNAAPTTPPPAAAGGGGGGGGGAPSTWFFLALGALAGLRRLTRKG